MYRNPTNPISYRNIVLPFLTFETVPYSLLVKIFHSYEFINLLLTVGQEFIWIYLVAFFFFFSLRKESHSKEKYVLFEENCYLLKILF